jgi:hypothetical protein
MAETVTLLRNPGPQGSKKRNPKRRNPVKRNPDMVGQITRPLPNLTQLGSALLGAGVVMQVPNMVAGSTRWVNVAYSLGTTIIGAMVLNWAKAGKEVVSGFAIGGSVVTASKALHVGTGGRFGLDPQMNFAQTAGIRSAGASYAPMGEAASMNELPDYAGTTGIVRPAVGAFRESQYDGAESDEPLIG